VLDHTIGASVPARAPVRLLRRLQIAGEVLRLCNALFLEGGFVALVWHNDRERHRLRGCAKLNDDVDQRLGPFWIRAVTDNFRVDLRESCLAAVSTVVNPCDRRIRLSSSPRLPRTCRRSVLVSAHGYDYKGDRCNRRPMVRDRADGLDRVADSSGGARPTRPKRRFVNVSSERHRGF